MNEHGDNDTAIGANIKRLRSMAGLTQQELATRLDWNRVSVAQAEAGKRRFRIDDLATICKALRVSYRALLAGQDDTLVALDPLRKETRELLVAALGDGSDEEPLSTSLELRMVLLRSAASLRDRQGTQHVEGRPPENLADAQGVLLRSLTRQYEQTSRALADVWLLHDTKPQPADGDHQSPEEAETAPPSATTVRVALEP